MNRQRFAHKHFLFSIIMYVPHKCKQFRNTGDISGFREPGSSVSIVSGYGLDDRAIQVRSPAEAKDFSSNL
jgi:hypothetical protein